MIDSAIRLLLSVNSDPYYSPLPYSHLSLSFHVYNHIQSAALHTAVDKLCATYFAAIEADRLSVEQTLGTSSHLSYLPYPLLFSHLFYLTVYYVLHISSDTVSTNDVKTTTFYFPLFLIH